MNDIRKALESAFSEAWEEAVNKTNTTKPTDITTTQTTVNTNLNDNESFFQYIDRMLEAIQTTLNLKGITLVSTSAKGNHFLTSRGIAAPIRLLDSNDERIKMQNKQTHGILEDLAKAFNEHPRPDVTTTYEEREIARLKKDNEVLKNTIKEACELLEFCLEWDNGGEREYNKIINFINKYNM